jgi:predicted ATP-binding protein involved in virulence
MGNVTDLNEFRKKKEIEEERKVARELQQLLSEIMYDDETPLIISYEDSDGIHYYNLDEIMGLSDSNPYEK